jgi:NAD(P)-dependent dehydrogenase (short-subunit alcohol dehydrogenase family)
VFSCAGVATGTPGIERVNFVGHRHLIDRLIDSGALGSGGAIGFISSAAGLGWETHLEEYKDGALAATDFDSGTRWFQENNKCDYMATKQVICAYVASQAFPMLKKGIRINAICPGPTETPLAIANKEMWLAFGEDYRQEVGTEVSTPLEQAYPLLFLCSDAAAAINGVILISDTGYMPSGVTGSFPPATPVADLLLHL